MRCQLAPVVGSRRAVGRLIFEGKEMTETGALTGDAVAGRLPAPPPLPESSSEELSMNLLIRKIQELTDSLTHKDDLAEADDFVCTDLNYTDSWPAVEVTFVLIEIVSFDIAAMTFEIEFCVDLDWLDSKLRRSIDYEYSAESGKFEFMKSLTRSQNDCYFFNPKIVLENSKVVPDESDHCPDIIDEVFEDGCDIPWVHKRFHFTGSISCRGVDARFFPFDIETLHVKITGSEMGGKTSKGELRRLKFTEPKLRKNLRYKLKRAGRPTPGFAHSHQEDTIMPHMWRMDPDGGDTLKVGEMIVIAFGGAVDKEDTVYDFTMVLRRSWFPRYFFDILIYNLQTLAASFSLFTPYDGDMLANRMSITLTVLLTVVGVSTTRPKAIEDLPYQTLHDWYGQLMVFSVLMIGVSNLFNYTNCWGMYREAGVADVYDEKLQMIVNNLRTDGFPGSWWCQNSLNDSQSNMDHLTLWFTVLSLTVLFIFFICTSQVHRLSVILRVKHFIDSNDYTILADGDTRAEGYSRGEFSNLVMCSNGFYLPSRFDLKMFCRPVLLVPGFRCFWRMWRASRAVRRCCPDRLYDELTASLEDTPFHPLDSLKCLYHADQKNLLIQSRKLPSLSKFRVQLSPFDVFRVLDVGSGECGFYSYWLDEGSRLVKASGTSDKLKYSKGATFVSQFLESKEGWSEMVRELVERFSLSPVPTRSAHRPPPKDDAPIFLPGEVQSDSPELDLKDMNPAATDSPGAVADAWMQPQATRVVKKPVVMCLTGANRQMLQEDEKGRQLLDDFCARVSSALEPYGLVIHVYIPEDKDEAMYELVSTEWVVQHGDLAVKDITLKKAFRTLRRGFDTEPCTWKEVQTSFADLKAEADLKEAYVRAAAYTPRDGQLPETVICESFYAAFEASPPLLRALVRARLFSGTISAGSGSSQATLRVTGSLESSGVHSLPVGNRTPLVSLKLNNNDQETLTVFSRQLPRTRALAQQLLLEQSAESNLMKIAQRKTAGNLQILRSGSRGSADAHTPNETKPAWTEDCLVVPAKLDLWRRMIKACCEEQMLPTSCRGLFVGISAVFYAAKAAGCANKILTRDEFLHELAKKITALGEKAGKGTGRDTANLTLVYEVVNFMLHRTASIVCKRNWLVGSGSDKTEFAATWTLGLYLKHSGVMGIPLKVSDPI